MALDFLDRCKWSATSSGTGDYTVSAASTLFLTPAQAGATNALTYRYVAESTGNAEWEVGTGTYNSTATTSTTNVTVSRSSGNVVFSSNSNTIVAFTAAPTVRLGGPLARDMHWEVIGDTTVSSPVAEVVHTFDPSLYAEIMNLSIYLVPDTVGTPPASWGFEIRDNSSNVLADQKQFTDFSAFVTARIELFGPNQNDWLYIVTPRSDLAGSNPSSFNSDVGTTPATKIAILLVDALSAAVNIASGRIITYGLRLP